MTVDVQTTFYPPSVLPLARRVMAERAAERAIQLDVASAAEILLDSCQRALEHRSYSDAPSNPRGRQRVLQETNESPAVDELADTLTQFILQRYGGRVPTPAQRQNSRGFAHKRLGLFLNQLDEFLDNFGPDTRSTISKSQAPRDEDEVLEDVLRPRKRRLGNTASQRRAVEQRAVDVVTELLQAEGWDVTDVGATIAMTFAAQLPTTRDCMSRSRARRDPWARWS